MYLHNDKDLFSEVITEVNTKTGIAQSIVEKDYYVSIILKLLAKSNPSTVSRTFIDKVYALCDYYLEGKTKRFSRRLYDIHKLYPTITIDDTFKELTEQVREHRSHLSICPSAKEGVDAKKLIYEFLDKDFYKSDYDTITKTLISDEVTYEQAALTLREIAGKLF